MLKKRNLKSQNALAGILRFSLLGAGLMLPACSTTNNPAYRIAVAALTGVDIGSKAEKGLSQQLDPNDPNVICKPAYTQVYQPPLKLGGAGRVIQVANGEVCAAISTEVFGNVHINEW